MKDFVIRGSSAGIFRNGEFLAGAEAGCPRRTILRHLNAQEEIKEATKLVFALGAQFEDYYATIVPDTVRELEVKFGNFTGHVDFADDEYLYETKSISSKNTLSVIKKGRVKLQNLLQICHYLVALERTKAKLVYGDYTKTITYQQIMTGSFEWVTRQLDGAIPTLHEFLIEIKDDGFIYVNGKVYENLHVSEFIDFQDRLNELVEADELPPRAEPIETGWGADVCKYCPFQMLCNSNPSTIEDFVEGAQEVVEALSLEI